MKILFENEDIIAFNKTEYIRVQADTSGRDSMEAGAAEFLAARSAGEPSPGDGGSAPEPPFIGLVHRLDQPVTGVVLFAKNPESLARMSGLFREGKMRKIYWAVIDAAPPSPEGTLEHHLVFNRRQNKVYAARSPGKETKKASLRYRLLGRSERYFFLEVELLTGRHHQIRAQLAAVGCHVKGDLKYGSARSNPGGGIHLHARSLAFTDPKTGKEILVTAPPPEDVLWSIFPGAAPSGG